MPFFLKKGRGRGGGKAPGATVGNTQRKRRKNDDDEAPRVGRRRKLEENEEILSDDEYSGGESDKHVSEASDAEYEDTKESNYRQAKDLLDKLLAEGDLGESADEEEEEQFVAGKLREHAASKAGTLQRQIARGIVIDEEKEISHRSHRFSPLALAISPCSRYVVSTGKESHVIKYDLQEKKTVGSIKRQKKIAASQQKAHSGHIFAVAISPDGKYLATGGVDCIVKIWNFETLAHVRDLEGHRQPITSLCFRLRTTQLFSASRDRTVKLWDLEQMGLVDTMYGHQDAVLDIDALNRERVLTCGGQDRTIRLWKVDTESQLILNGLQECVSIDCVAMLNEDHFLSGSADGSLCVWSVFKKKPTCVRKLAHGKREVTAEPHWVVSVAACPFTDLAASGSGEGQLRLWRIAQDYRSIVLIYEYEMFGFVNDMRFSADGKILACGVGKEHKFGRWWIDEDAQNSIVVLALSDGTSEPPRDEPLGREADN
ncbi:unnamed protein product, partial [Mesorhabditis spiculigera]